MSDETDTFWASLNEKFIGIILLIIGAIMLYYTATSTDVLGTFSTFFGVLSVVMVGIGVFLLVVRPPQ